MSYIGEGINQTATSVETAKDEFFGTYYGQISSDPTVDPNGNPITDGDLFYNTSEEALKIRVNGEWLSLRTATTGYQQFTATSGQTTFDVAGSFSPGFVFVTLNGVVLASGDYDDSSGTSIVLTSGAADGDILGVYLFDTFSVADTVSASAGGTFSGPVNFSDNITLDNNIRISGKDTSSGSVLLATVGGSDGTFFGDGNENVGATLRSGNNIAFQTGGFNERARIDSSGNLLVGTTTSPSDTGAIVANSGVYLGGTGSANKLDDYETGTWTPRLFQSDSEVTDANYDSFFNEGSYTKIGRLVTLNAIFRLVSKGSLSDTGNVQIGNIPFANTGGGIGERRGYAHFARSDSIANHLYGEIFGGSSVIRLNSSSGVTGSDITNSTYLTFSVIYYTDS